MAEIINLRQARKNKARAEKEARATENRISFGRTKAEKTPSKAEQDLAKSRPEGHKRDPDETPRMGFAVLKRSVSIAGHRTSISLEEPFWDGLREIAERETISVQSLIGRIDAERGEQNLSSAIRVFVLNDLRSRLETADQRVGGAP